MSVADLVRAMAAAGAPAEAIALAVEAVEARDRQDAQRRADRAAARKRQRHARDMAATVARHDGDEAATVAASVSPVPPPEDNNQTPHPTPSGISQGGRDASAWPKDGFERFYAAYPRKKARQDAEKAYRTVERQKGLTFDTVMAGVQRLVASNPDAEFVPYPATWLRAGQWADEPDPTPRPSSRSPPDRLTQADHILNAHHSLFGQPDDRDHHEVEIFPPGPDQGHRRPDRPLHGPDAGDIGAGRVRDFRGLRAVG